MKFKELLESGANVSVTVSLDDLKQIFKEVAGGLKPVRQEPPPEEFLSRKEVLALLKIDSSPLWNWEKTGYIKSYPFGGRNATGLRMQKRSAPARKECIMGSSEKFRDLKRISIREYLSRRGIAPKIEKPGYGMYFSPFREERTPSFKVDWNANLWHDFGTGEGGSVIDLVARIENCSVGEAVRRLEDNQLLPTVNRTVPADNGRVEIRSVSPLNHPALVDYLRDRCIDLLTARKYCNEIRYRIGEREYFAIGFRNDAGGWELRNRSFKGSSTPKNITTIRNGSDTVMVFEGFMGFLSYLSLKANPSPTIDTAVLNSVANLAKAVPFLESHRTVHAFLDNDDAGRKSLANLRELLPGSEVVDQSAFYRNHKDLNDYWRERCTQKIQPKIPVKKNKSGPKL